MTSQNSDQPNHKPLTELIDLKLQTVYDPEFPMIDIWTLGLIYQVDVSEDEKHIELIMTMTTPACPMAEMIIEMVKNALYEVAPGYTNEIEVTFDPPWTPEKIKDEDLQRMFM